MPNEFKVKNGLIVDRGGINITGSSSISGSLGINSSGSNLLTVDGVSGRLFTVDDSFTGSLFSVNTVAGLPIIEAFSDNTVRIGQHGQRAFFVSQSNVGFGKEASIGAKVDVSGSVLITGSLSVTSGITGSLFGTSSFAVSSSRAVTSSFALTASFLIGGGGGGGSSITIADEGTSQGAATFLNFTGSGVTATVSANTASINIPGNVYKTALQVIGTSENLIPATIRPVERLIFRGTTSNTGTTQISLTGINIGLLLNLYGTIEISTGFFTNMPHTNVTFPDGEISVTKALCYYRPAINSIIINAQNEVFNSGTTAIVAPYTVVIEFQQV